ncbi:Thioredoxin [Gracilibacillus ureilyticus]|uniref:Thioredoxin n=1 Tax=Gracilibacillus ureilyticus TaxID=531814 RepID=A0A1H9M5E4_9BACI|nr:thioredoxin family protein [Gracilibacillus ureilyticus]SER18892.1 Thioredoxin [Gracilibacillus ureilyticus]
MNSFTTLQTETEIHQFIDNNPLSFVYISKNNCSVCHSLYPQIQSVMQEFPNIRLGYIVIDELPSLAGQWSIYTAPVLILFVDGKEYLREARFVPVESFREKVERIYQNYA